jgi:hypothetical protein
MPDSNDLGRQRARTHHRVITVLKPLIVRRQSDWERFTAAPTATVIDKAVARDKFYRSLAVGLRQYERHVIQVPEDRHVDLDSIVSYIRASPNDPVLAMLDGMKIMASKKAVLPPLLDWADQLIKPSGGKP